MNGVVKLSRFLNLCISRFKIQDLINQFIQCILHSIFLIYLLSIRSICWELTCDGLVSHPVGGKDGVSARSMCHCTRKGFSSSNIVKNHDDNYHINRVSSSLVQTSLGVANLPFHRNCY